MSATLQSIVGQWVLEQPGLARVFEKLGIDYCCGGKKPLDAACRAKGLDPAAVLTVLSATQDAPNKDQVNVANMSLTELADHIESTHHAYVKAELPRLQPLIEKIARKHSDKNSLISQLPTVFSAFRSDMEAHMAKEEQVLFPLIRNLDSGDGHTSCACGTIENPIKVMEIEHQHAGDAFQLMRKLTDNFSTPEGACNTYRGVMYSLAELEADLHQHVHKENNVLFPKAAKLATALPAVSR